ncbi:hypothetical protein EZS27_005153 [termite gut metagenome]|uniref:Uncharacterized protein n=1 Tax=termite gut metagenome TaxID=433724 RepID=A0A5J4SPP5_9ZZZZ
MPSLLYGRKEIGCKINRNYTHDIGDAKGMNLFANNPLFNHSRQMVSAILKCRE